MAAEVAISQALELLGNLLIEKIKSLRGVKEKVELLKDELKRMQSFLKDANKKQFEEEGVRNWISEIREVAQDAQDTIQLFLLNAEDRRGFLPKITSSAKRMYYLQRIGEEIDSIQTRLDAIDKSCERYGFKVLGEAVESGRRLQIESRRRLCHWQKDEHLVGIEDDVKKLLRESILNEERKGLSIAVLEGMGGIGKSTLSREVYNHPDVVADRFDCRAWVVVSSEFSLQETIKQLILQLPSSEEEKKNLHDLEESTKDKLFIQQKLQEMLHKQLKGKTYFIVLDDVWKREDWESLRTAFVDEQDKASRLLVTTRNKVIAKHADYAHEMKHLDPQKSWELLLKKALIDKCREELESIGREIVGKCKGLPLAISMVGGLLVGKQTKSEWESLLKQINSHLGRSESPVSAILELSYQNLSPQLKSCFLCLAFFKEDATITRKSLEHIWFEHGLIKQEGGRTMKVIAEGYLDELINQNMVQIKDLSMGDRVKNCHLHDLVREVCLRKAKEEIGLEIVKGEEGSSSKSSYKPRHRVVYGKTSGTLSNDNKHIRSLFLVNINEYHVKWKSFQLLETLHVNKLDEFPPSFHALIGLKYLRIGGSSGRTIKIPRWLDRLKKLEVLDMGCRLVKFRTQVSLEMDRLRYFCGNIVGGPRSIHNWKKLECLKCIRAKDWMRYISKSHIVSDCCLSELGIMFYESMEPQELSRVRASLEKMEKLVILHLTNLSLSSIDITSAIPHLHITKLKLSGPMMFPSASTLPPNLSHLTMTSLYLEENPMAELGKLPKLAYLNLQRQAYIAETMQVLKDGFPCLEALTLGEMKKLKSVVVEEGGMPHVKHLRIRECPALETGNLPKHINISVE